MFGVVTMRTGGLLCVIFAALITCIQCGNHERYKGYRVLRVFPADALAQRLVKRAVDNKPGHLEVMHPTGRSTTGSMDILASEEALAEFLLLLKMLQIPLETVISDLPEAIRAHLLEN